MFHFKRNLPHWERAARIAGAIGLGFAAYTHVFAGAYMDLLLYGAAATFGLTAFVGFCPACAMVGRRYLDQ